MTQKYTRIHLGKHPYLTLNMYYFSNRRDTQINNKLFSLVFVTIMIKAIKMKSCVREITKCRFKKASWRNKAETAH